MQEHYFHATIPQPQQKNHGNSMGTDPEIRNGFRTFAGFGPSGSHRFQPHRFLGGVRFQSTSITANESGISENIAEPSVCSCIASPLGRYYSIILRPSALGSEVAHATLGLVPRSTYRERTACIPDNGKPGGKLFVRHVLHCGIP